MRYACVAYVILICIVRALFISRIELLERAPVRTRSCKYSRNNNKKAGREKIYLRIVSIPCALFLSFFFRRLARDFSRFYKILYSSRRRSMCRCTTTTRRRRRRTTKNQADSAMTAQIRTLHSHHVTVSRWPISRLGFVLSPHKYHIPWVNRTQRHPRGKYLHTTRPRARTHTHKFVLNSVAD